MNEIFTRVSIRKFKDQPVEVEKITAILRAAMQAPSAHNQQPWEFYVIRDRDLLEELSLISKYSMCIKNAPVAIVSAYRTEELPSPSFAQVDMSIAMENLWLEATSQGLGGVWIGTAPNEEVMKSVERILKLPGDQRAFAVFPFGYPAQEKEQQNRFDDTRIHWL